MNQDINKQLKVCHVTSSHPRYDVRIFHKECKSLSKHGFDVTLLVNDSIPDEFIDGITIRSTLLKSKSRFEKMVKSKKNLRKIMMQINAEVFHFHDPDLLLEATWIKKQGKMVIFDFHEDVSEQIIDKQWIPKIVRHLASYCYRKTEALLIKKYDAVISVTPHIVDKLSKYNSNSWMITNYPIVTSDNIISRSPSKSICFAGGISKQWGHEIIIGAISKLDDVSYILAGTGNEEYLKFLKTIKSWDKVDYRGKLQHEEVNKIYNLSLAGMALNVSTQIKDQGTLGNTKLFEYMAASLPVICTDNKLWREVIEGNNCGICIPPRNSNKISESILFLIENPDIAKLMGENGRAAVLNKYNWRTQEVELIKLYKELEI